MLNAIGARLPKIWSSNAPDSVPLTWRAALWLLGLGVASVLLHAATRDLIDIAPGYQGIGWIALLLVGRTTSRTRWAGVTTAVGAGATAMLPVWGFGDPFRWLMPLLAGAALDLGFWALYRWHDSLWLLAVLGGLAHMTKPLSRVVISEFTGWPYGSLLWGVAYPSATHFLFGALGAAIGAGLILVVRRKTAR